MATKPTWMITSVDTNTIRALHHSLPAKPKAAEDELNLEEGATVESQVRVVEDSD